VSLWSPGEVLDLDLDPERLENLIVPRRSSSITKTNSQPSHTTIMFSTGRPQGLASPGIPGFPVTPKTAEIRLTELQDSHARLELEIRDLERLVQSQPVQSRPVQSPVQSPVHLQVVGDPPHGLKKGARQAGGNLPGEFWTDTNSIVTGIGGRHKVNIGDRRTDYCPTATQSRPRNHRATKACDTWICNCPR
jgi:hypothetical protein